MERPKE